MHTHMYTRKPTSSPSVLFPLRKRERGERDEDDNPSFISSAKKEKRKRKRAILWVERETDFVQACVCVLQHAYVRAPVS